MIYCNGEEIPGRYSLCQGNLGWRGAAGRSPGKNIGPAAGKR